MIKAKQILHSRLILVVDDQEISRDVLSLILEEDYEVIYAVNGKEALEAIQENLDKLSMILLDLNMPVMNGYEVLERLHRDERMKCIPVIVLTSDKQAELKALHMGAVDFITKPFDMHEIVLARVQRMIELAEGKQLIDNTEMEPLTNLYSRSFFFEYAAQIARYHPEWHMDAIVLNVDGFHFLNELYGREYGDRLLQLIGEEIHALLDEVQGIATRFEGDHFAIFCQAVDDYSDLLARFRSRLTSIAKNDSLRLCMGVKPWSEEISPDLMFDQARAACNMARGNYHQRLIVYDEEARQKELYQQHLLNDLTAALEDHHLKVYFQPKYNIQMDPPRLSSAEALIRWDHPEYGLISPADFIPLFERNARIHLIDYYVLKATVLQIVRWRNRFNFSLPVSVNLSRHNVVDPDFEKMLIELVEQYQLHPSLLKLEVTESAYTDNAQQLINVFNRLRDYGFEIEMDDFGSGYSSLNMISRLPIDVLKMDMQFIRNIEDNDKDFRLVELILDIARYLGIPVVAEGVETENQISLLRAASCDLVQGYYFSKPLPAAEFELLIQREIEMEKKTEKVK